MEIIGYSDYWEQFEIALNIQESMDAIEENDLSFSFDLIFIHVKI